ncbi:MAG: hypothetical protein ABF248_11610 [Yoonia sp.]
MKRIVFGCVLVLAGCDDAAMMSAGASGGSASMQERLVLGSSMSFEQCQARGGWIIKDAGSPMMACDPNVIRAPVPEDEFNNPSQGGDAASDA